MRTKTKASLLVCAVASLVLLPSCDRLHPEVFSCDASAMGLPADQFALGYFPSDYGEPAERCGGELPPWPLISEVEEEWYPSQLSAACEPSLYSMSQSQDAPDFILRFSYIPSFNSSVFISVRSDGDTHTLIARQLSGYGGYDPGSLARYREFELTDEQFSELQDILDADGLLEQEADTCNAGFDGSQWLFEVVDPDGYRLVKRWSPSQGPAYRLGTFLLNLSGFGIEPY